MVDDHRTFCSNRFLHRRAPGFADEQMVLVHHAGEFVRPANELYWVPICGGVNVGPEFISAADCHRKIEIKFREQTHQFRRATFGCMNHVQNPTTRIGAGERSGPVFDFFR